MTTTKIFLVGALCASAFALGGPLALAIACIIVIWSGNSK